MADTDIAVTSLTAEGGAGTIMLKWGYTDATSPLPYLKMHHFEVWVASVNNRASASKATDTPDLNYTLPGLDYGATRYFWVRGVDVSGNLGDFNPPGATSGVAGTAKAKLEPSDLGDTLAAMTEYFGLSIRDLNEHVQLATSGAADQDLANYADRVYLLEKQVVGDDVTYAASVKALLLAVGADGTSIADALSAVQTASGDVTAGFLSRVTALASPGGGWVRYGMELRASLGTALIAASDYWEVNTGSRRSRRVTKASEHYIVDDAGNIIAMFGTGGSYVAKAVIPELTVEKLEIVARGLTFESIVFEHNVTTVGGSAVSNRAAWTAGTVRYVNDAGVATSASISAGNTSTWSSGTIYIYWVKGATSFSTTTSAATAFATNNVVIATYKGGADLVATYGKLTIDGGNWFKQLSLDTPSMTNNAVTTPSYQPLSDYVYNNTNTAKLTEDTIATASFVPEGGQLLVIAQGKARVTTNVGTAWGNFDVKLKRNGSLIKTISGLTYDENGVGQELDGPFVFVYVDTSPGTSSIPWTITATGLGANGARYSQFIDLSFTFMSFSK